MSSQVDSTKPVAGSATTSSVRDNFSTIIDEIKELQAQVGLFNLDVSVAANEITVELKTAAGADATSTTGIEFSFRNVTKTSGDRVDRSVTAALSEIAPQGATFGFSGSENANIYVYLVDNAGTLELGLSKKLFDDSSVQSTTLLNSSSDSATVLYSATALTDKPIALIGRFKIQTGATAGDWSNSPSEVATFFAKAPTFDESSVEITGGTLDSVTITGSSVDGTSTTQSSDDDSTNIATTAFVQALVFDKKNWPTITNDVTDADHDIVFGTGSILNSSSSQVIELTSALTKQIDAAWTAGDSAGGLFSGTVAADTAYACFLIVKDSDGSIDAGFDTSATAANIPSGYTAYRRIGWVITDSSANIVPFFSDGDIFHLKSQIEDFSNTSPGTSANIATVAAPPNVYAIYGISLALGGSAQVIVTSTLQDDTVPSTSNLTLRVTSNSQTGSVEINVKIDTSRQIRYRSSTGSVSALKGFTRGWFDQRL